MEGYSYGYIKKTLNLKSKGTISIWLKNIDIPEQVRKKLEKNNLLAIKRGLASFNTERSARIKVENKFAYDKGFGSIPKNLTKRDLLLIGVSLYWAEGGKAGADGPSPKFVFSNSDQEMVKVFMRFIREVLSIENNDIRGGIHLYPNTDILQARFFWSKISGLPKDRFYIITQVSKASKGIREKKLPYGTLHIKINRRLVFFKMKGMIDGMIGRLKV